MTATRSSLFEDPEQALHTRCTSLIYCSQAEFQNTNGGIKLFHYNVKKHSSDMNQNFRSIYGDRMSHRMVEHFFHTNQCHFALGK